MDQCSRILIIQEEDLELKSCSSAELTQTSLATNRRKEISF